MVISFCDKKVKNTVPWTFVIDDLSGEAMKKNCKKQIKKNRIEKVIINKGNKLYVKWKRYDNSLNSWIDKNNVI